MDGKDEPQIAVDSYRDRNYEFWRVAEKGVLEAEGLGGGRGGADTQHSAEVDRVRAGAEDECGPPLPLREVPVHSSYLIQALLSGELPNRGGACPVSDLCHLSFPQNQRVR